MSSHRVVVDGSNIATEGRSLPSLKQLDEAVRAYRDEHPDAEIIVVVDATFAHRISDEERPLFEEAAAHNELVYPPAGAIGRGDAFLLRIADKTDAVVLSNDSFQEFHGEYEWLFDEGRLVGGKPVPGVGWVFIERTPVRGPRSRMAVRASTRKRARAASGSAAKKAQHTGPTSSGTDLGPKPVPKSPPPRKKKAAPPAKPSAKDGSKDASKDVSKDVSKEVSKDPSKDAGKAQTRGRDALRASAKSSPAEPANQPLPFIEFVAEHQPGSTVEGEVTQFSSHGAYITVGNVRCYAPLKLLGTPAPRSAREVLKRGETRMFVVHAIHAARRGIDLALPEAAQIEAPVSRAPVPRNRPSARRGATTGNTVPEVQASLPIGTDQAPGDPEAELRESEATLAPAKKGTARKAASKKAAPRKAAARKSAAKKTTARKTTARKSTARKSTAKKSTAKKSAAKKSTARKSAAKKTTAKRGAAKKATKKKATARKTTARKSTAKKSTAKKSTAKKATRKRTAKKATAKKAPARKRTAKKTTARKTTARKRTTKRASAAKKR
jgi:hypothetical protein